MTDSEEAKSDGAAAGRAASAADTDTEPPETGMESGEESAPDHAPDPEIEDGPALSDAKVDPEGVGGREVVVPLRLYKSITVFSTAIAVLCIVTGFLFFDAATLRPNSFFIVVRVIADYAGLPVPRTAVSFGFAFLGLGMIGAGSVVYLLGTRFKPADRRAESGEK